MDRLRTGELRLLLDTLQALYAAQNLDRFRAEGVHAIARLIPCEFTGYAEMDPARRMSEEWFSPAEVDDPARNQAWERHMHAHPRVDHYRRTGDGHAMLIGDFVTSLQFRDSALYAEVYRPLRVTGWLGTIFPSPPPRVMGLALHRSGRDFSERDRLLLDLLRPHVVQSHRNAQELSRLEEELALYRRGYEDLQRGVITLRGQRIATATPAARRWLTQYFPAPRRAPAQLPDELRRWVAREWEQLTAEDTVPAARGPMSVQHDGARLLVRLIPGATQHVLLLTEERLAPTFAPLERLGLTRREAEVLMWVAEGKTNAEIGTILGARPKTVGKHLKRIFQKLGVETRTAAARIAVAAAGPGTTGKPQGAPHFTAGGT